MLIGALIAFGALIVSWLLLPGKQQQSIETTESASSFVGELLQSGQAR